MGWSVQAGCEVFTRLNPKRLTARFMAMPLVSALPAGVSVLRHCHGEGRGKRAESLASRCRERKGWLLIADGLRGFRACPAQ